MPESVKLPCWLIGSPWLQVHDLIEKICEIERQFNPQGSAALIQEIKAVSQTATHMYVLIIRGFRRTSNFDYSAPHYHVVSRTVNAGFLTTVVNWIRQYLVEEVYRRLGKFLSLPLCLVCIYAYDLVSYNVSGNWKLAHICRRNYPCWDQCCDLVLIPSCNISWCLWFLWTSMITSNVSSISTAYI